MNGFNFTERVRKVLAMAREEAAGLHHGYVGTEHILLGLIAEGQGVAATVIENLGADPQAMRDLVMKTVRGGSTDSPSHPDLPYTSRAKKVLELSMNEARELNHSYVGTEHLLLGLLAEQKGIAAQVLFDSGLTLDNAREETVRILGSLPASGMRSAARPPLGRPADEMWAVQSAFMERLHTVISRGHEMAAERGQTNITPVHLALALLEHEGGMANVVLDRIGFDRQGTIDALNRIGPSSPSPVPPESVLRMDETTVAVLRALNAAMTETHSELAGTQHLLVALLDASRDVAAVFAAEGITADAVREQLRYISG